MNKNQELEALYDTVAQLYFKNLQFLETQQPALFNKIKAFEALNIEQYFLEFVNNHFELINANGKHYYGCNPFLDAQHRCQNIEEKPAFNLLKTEEITNGVNYKNSINAFEYINDFLELPNNKEKKPFDKFIFLGTLLGVHLNDIHNALKAKAYLVCEQNLEIFRLSIFLTDYETLHKDAKLFFCIAEDESNTHKSIDQFLNYKPQYNHQIGFEVAREENISFIDTLTKACVDYDPYNYPFSEYLVSLKRSFYCKLQTKHGLLDCSKQQNILAKPILFLGAGPSLASSIEWVYMHQNAFTLVCAAACLRRLELLDIVPDIILSADGQYKQVIRQFDVQEKYYKNSLAIVSVKTDFEVLQKLNAANTFFMPDNLELFENSGFLTGVTVGDIGLDLLLRMGAKTIYMLGFDASVSLEGKTHDGIYKTNKVALTQANSVKNSGINTRTDLIKVKGNFEEEVWTFIQYKQMIDSIETIVSNHINKAKIYNLSNGAYFKHTLPLKKENINWNEFTALNKNELKNSIKEALKALSSKTLTPQDINDIKQEQKIIKKLQTISIAQLTKEFNKLKSTYKNSLSLQILEKFFDLITPYSTSKNTQKAEELRYKQFKEIVNELEKFYSKLNYPIL
ncbi:MAG: 6-hydroxymethylpterin diphosphokinase MptE-like protein [Arcobacteraceae bacterium]